MKKLPAFLRQNTDGAESLGLYCGKSEGETGMRKRYMLHDGWKICCVQKGQGLPAGEYPSDLPTSVQDILCRNGVIPEEARNGADDLRWVAEQDWIYTREFSVLEEPGQVHAVLHFLGVDTVAEYFLNGIKIGDHESMYLRKEMDVSSLLKKDNILKILFHSPVKEIERLAKDMPAEWKEVIDQPRLLRKALADSGTFLGNMFPCSCVGLYDEVFLELSEAVGRIADLDIRQNLSWDLKKAVLALSVCTEGIAGQCRFYVLDGNGEIAASAVTGMGEGTGGCVLEVSEPELWWPAPYGPQNLYTVRAELFSGETCLDRIERRIGLRYVEYEGDFRFKINHERIRLWGSNFVNVDGMTHWCDRERVAALVEYACEGHFNIFRIWGEAPMLPDLFYDLCDEKGILVWQDFGLGFGPWPDSPRYQDLFGQEVRQMVGRLKHHPAILLWCGSNETYMTAVSEPLRNGKQFGLALIFRVGADICRELDPDRVYIPSSPMGGNYPQDAGGGDIHGYWGNDFEPGLRYPVLFSESCHATTYCRHSMDRFMTEEEIWPEGFADTHVYDPGHLEIAVQKAEARKHSYALVFQNHWRQLSVPAAWRRHLSEFAPSELWDLEDYFDAHDADSILYKYSVCGADFYKREIERIRRGRPCRTPYESRRCSGYLTWKYNDAWPHINFTQIDYYLEPTAQYYALKRGFAPVLAGVSAEQDHLYLWAVNDSGKDVQGEIVLRVFSRLCNRILGEYRYPVSLRADESKTLDCLDWMGSLPREQILHTAFTGAGGEDYGTNVCYLDKERNLSFPKPVLELSWKEGMLEVKTDRYARYVELIGMDESGDRFGWKFSDNYFDLLPFETKRIGIGGKHSCGWVTAKAFYGEKTAGIQLHIKA